MARVQTTEGGKRFITCHRQQKLRKLEMTKKTNSRRITRIVSPELLPKRISTNSVLRSSISRRHIRVYTKELLHMPLMSMPPMSITRTMTCVFLCMDAGSGKKFIVEKLIRSKSPGR